AYFIRYGKVRNRGFRSTVSYKKMRNTIHTSATRIGTVYVKSHILEMGHFACFRLSKVILYSGNTAFTCSLRSSSRYFCLAWTYPQITVKLKPRRTINFSTSALELGLL